jgi:hypothetical protein
MHPSLRLRPLLAAVGAALALAACDSPSATTPAPPASPVSVRMECSADVRSGTVSCAPPGAAAGARADRIVGGQGVNVRTVTGNVAVNADTFAFDLAVTNLLPAPIGTTDGMEDPDGVKVFFVDGVHTTGGTGLVSVANADGMAAFTAANQAFFAYHGIVPTGQTSGPRRWKLRFDAGVLQFAFSLLVSAPYPPGSGSVFLTIEQPTNGQEAVDSVGVVARIDSASASVVSVVAILGSTLVPMTVQANGKRSGTVSLVGHEFGPLTIAVRATTETGEAGVEAVDITRVPPPGFFLVTPTRSRTAARPSGRIDGN